MRVCVVGGGLAGSLLAWRLGRAATGLRVDVFTGGRRGGDATAASGGAVRCYEEHPEQRRLAIASMAELLASRVLREWAEYRPTGAVYLARDATGLDAAVADIEHLVPGSATAVATAELARHGWAGLPAGGGAVVERAAGYTSPSRLRDAALADADADADADANADAGPGVAVHDTAAGPVRVDERGAVTCGDREYDAVVVAAGPWTTAVLAAGGLPSAGYRTRSIQYVVHRVDGWRPPHFVDEFTGLYGRPTADGGLLLGVPTDRWDVDPDGPAPVAGLAERAAGLAAARFPALRLGPIVRRACAADCYMTKPVLALRPVHPGLFTFTGGAGGAVKTALAASALAAVQLTASY